jgi:TPR repeat protein
MKYWAGHALWGMAAAAGIAAFGCGGLGNGSYGGLPEDVHRKPTREEIANNPCKHGDVQSCISRCQSQDAKACNMVGVMFEFDSDGRDDPGIASGFYRRACDSTYAPGCNNLAWLYLRGRGVPVDRPQAMRLFYYAFDAAQLACLRGEVSNCALAGELLMEDRVEGVDDRNAKAVAFFERACAGGDSRSCESAALLR